MTYRFMKVLSIVLKFLQRVNKDNKVLLTADYR